MQDRLIKEMRLAGLSDMEEGNAFLASYMEKHNRQSSVQPASDVDADRPVLHDQQELDLILSRHSKRKLSKNLTLQYNNVLYPVKIKGIGYAMRGTSVTVCEDFQGNITLLYKGKPLSYATWKRGEAPPAIKDSKEINQAVDPGHQPADSAHGMETRSQPSLAIIELRIFPKEEISTLG